MKGPCSPSNSFVSQQQSQQQLRQQQNQPVNKSKLQLLKTKLKRGSSAGARRRPRVSSKATSAKTLVRHQSAGAKLRPRAKNANPTNHRQAGNAPGRGFEGRSERDGSGFNGASNQQQNPQPSSQQNSFSQDQSATGSFRGNGNGNHRQQHSHQIPPPAAAAAGAGFGNKPPPTRAISQPIVSAEECTRRSGCPCAACNGLAPPDAFAGGGGDNRQKCPHCPRKFNAKALAKHVPICIKSGTKRKAFNAGAKRAAAMAAENGLDAGLAKKVERAANKAQRAKMKAQKKAKKPGATKKKKNAKWAAQSNALRAAMRSARGAPVDASAPPAAPDPSLKPCPHCGRTFNETARERHIGHCKNSRSKPKRLRKGGGISAGSRAARMNRKGKRTSAKGKW